MTLRRLSLLTFAVLAAAVAGVAWRAPSWSADLIARRLGSALARPVTVGSVRYALFPFRAEVRDLRIAGPAPSDPAFLEVPLIVAAPSLRPLLDRRLDLYELKVVGPRVRVRAFAAGGDDIPRLNLGRRGAAELRVRRLLIAGGELWVNHQRVPLDLDLPSFEGRLAQRGPGLLGGRLAFGPGEARFGKAPPLSLATTMDLALHGGLVSIESARLRGPKTDLVYRGQLRLSPGIRADLELSGALDLGVVDRHVLVTGFDLEGAAHFQGWARVEGSRVRLGGRLSGTDGRFDGIDVPRYSGDVAWDAEGVHLRKFAASFLDGSGVFDVDVPPAPSDATLEATLRGVDAERLAAYLFDLGLPGVGSAATGQVALRWPRGRIRALTGTLAMDLAPVEGGRTPLGGRIAWHARQGTQFLDEATLRTPETEARLQGKIEPSGAADLAVEAASADLQSSDALGARVRRALRATAAEPIGWSGAGSFQGRWRGTLAAPIFQGRFTGQQVGFLGVDWGRAEWSGSAEPDRIRMDSLVVRRGGGELRIEGWMETGFLGEADALDLRVRVRDWPAADFTRALAWDLDLQGPVTGEAALHGRRSAPLGTARFASARGTFAGVGYEGLRVASTLRGTATEVTAGAATVAGGQLEFRGTVDDAGVYDGEGSMADVDLSAVAARAGIAVPWRGRLSGRAVLAGTLDRPRLAARVDGRDVALGTERVGTLRADLLGTGDGAIALDAGLASERLELAVTGRVGAVPPYEADLSGAMRKATLDPFLRQVMAALPADVGVAAAAGATLRGPLARPGELTAEAEMTNVELRLPDYPVANRGPLAVHLREGRIAVERFHLAGEGTDLELSGSAAVLGAGSGDVSVQGAADLRALSLLSDELRGHGGARLAIRIGGSRRAPEVAGTLDLDGAGIRMRGFPHGVEDLRGRVAFDARGAQWSGVTGTLGGGTVELAGQAAHRDFRLVSFDVQASGNAISLRYPEGLKSTVDAELRLFGDDRAQWLTGTVDVREAVWTRRYDVASELLATAPAASRDAGVGGGVRFDVKVRAPGTLRIDNNLATLQARADLALQGTYDAPAVLGRAEIDRGRVYFQGNTYVIRRGTIDFSNPQKIDPLFDVEAETRVRSYNVVLKTQGTLERVTPTLTSDPPLSTVAILSLLAGADESEVERTAGFRDHRDLAAAGAATLAAGRLSEQFGLERRAGRLGLNRFSIDPTVGVRGEEYRNPGVRLTAGKRVTPELSVVYSQELRGTDERLLSVEYSLSDKVSVLLTRAAPGGLGFDVRLRRSE